MLSATMHLHYTVSRVVSVQVRDRREQQAAVLYTAIHSKPINKSCCLAKIGCSRRANLRVCRVSPSYGRGGMEARQCDFNELPFGRRYLVDVSACQHGEAQRQPGPRAEI